MYSRFSTKLLQKPTAFVKYFSIFVSNPGCELIFWLSTICLIICQLWLLSLHLEEKWDIFGEVKHFCCLLCCLFPFSLFQIFLVMREEGTEQNVLKVLYLLLPCTLVIKYPQLHLGLCHDPASSPKLTHTGLSQMGVCWETSSCFWKRCRRCDDTLLSQLAWIQCPSLVLEMVFHFILVFEVPGRFFKWTVRSILFPFKLSGNHAPNSGCHALSKNPLWLAILYLLLQRMREELSWST